MVACGPPAGFQPPDKGVLNQEVLIKEFSDMQFSYIKHNLNFWKGCLYYFEFQANLRASKIPICDLSPLIKVVISWARKNIHIFNFLWWFVNMTNQISLVCNAYLSFCLQLLLLMLLPYLGRMNYNYTGKNCGLPNCLVFNFIYRWKQRGSENIKSIWTGKIQFMLPFPWSWQNRKHQYLLSFIQKEFTFLTLFALRWEPMPVLRLKWSPWGRQRLISSLGKIWYWCKDTRQPVGYQSSQCSRTISSSCFLSLMKWDKKRMNCKSKRNILSSRRLGEEDAVN